MARTITLAHSPDSDDAFMFYALAKGKVDTRGLTFKHVLEDIETLNRKAIEGAYEVTAVSFHAYYKIRERYRLMTAGASVGDGYGPIIVSKRALSRDQLDEVTVGVPGLLTTAFLVFRLFAPGARWKVMPFDKIQEAVAAGNIDAGLIIHEGQLTYREMGLHKVLDLGEWWQKETDLPLPLGGNVIKRDLGKRMMERVALDIKKSIQYGLDHRQEAMDYAIQFSRGLDTQRIDRFIGMYVNDLTLDYGTVGKQAVRKLLSEAYKKKIIPERVALEFV